MYFMVMRLGDAVIVGRGFSDGNVAIAECAKHNAICAANGFPESLVWSKALIRQKLCRGEKMHLPEGFSV